MNSDIAFIILNSFGGLMLAFAVLRLIATIRAYRGIQRCPFGRAFFLSVRSARGLLNVVFIPATITTAILHQVSPGVFLPMPLWFGFGLSGIALSSSILPPSLLVLGCSCPSTLGFTSAVFQGFIPLRILHLLRQSGSDEVTRNDLRDGSNRVFTDWRGAVVHAVGFVPVIVIDLRSYTGPVHFELNHLFETGACKRTFFIVDEESISRLWSLTPTEFKRDLCVLDADTFVYGIRKIGLGAFKHAETDLYNRIRRSLHL
ncbi:hypothetical protein [Haloferula sp. A504]|uniref:hypothetical protein n=1 Tax=Haloferula sp. A504 TaxID=3373601 RepID=UPI0031BCB8C2|nr:hypothetical protein [Verrucomicrobiaceae bacterium E54]